MILSSACLSPKITLSTGSFPRICRPSLATFLDEPGAALGKCYDLADTLSDGVLPHQYDRFGTSGIRDSLGFV